MDSADFSSEFLVPESGSHLLSGSLLHSASSSRTGHGGEDLSLSELSLSDRPTSTHRRPFSLLAQPQPISNDDPFAEDEEADGEEGADQTMIPEDMEKVKRMAAKTREEKLQSDLFVLRKLNGAFEVYKEALRETKSSTERIADQLTHTNALLDKYVNILSKSEKVTKLILDERWQGADADEEQMELEAWEASEKKHREEEERAVAAQRELEREEREEQERVKREEREQLEREKAESAKTVSRGSGVRGVRGTRASMRGMRGATQARGATPPSTRGGIARPTSTGSGGIPVRQRGSSASVRGTATRASGIARRGG